MCVSSRHARVCVRICVSAYGSELVLVLSDYNVMLLFRCHSPPILSLAPTLPWHFVNTGKMLNVRAAMATMDYNEVDIPVDV